MVTKPGWSLMMSYVASGDKYDVYFAVMKYRTCQIAIHLARVSTL